MPRLGVLALAFFVAPAARADSADSGLRARCGLAPDDGRLARALGKNRAQEPSGVPLLGDPQTLAGQGTRIVSAIHEEFGADATCIRVVALPHSELQKRAVAPGWRKPAGPVDGLHRPGLGIEHTVLVELKDGLVDDLVLVHETLHALSTRFASEARRHHGGHFYEGATEYFARELVRRRFHAPPPLPHPYDPYVRLVERVIGVIGEAAFRAAFFDGGIARVAAAVNARAGADAFDTALRALEQDEDDEAMAALRRR